MRSLNQLRSLLRKQRVPQADKVATVSDLLRGQPGESVVLPMLPETGSGTASIEFAAASVLERIVLGAIVCRARPTRLFEIGTFRGLTALSMAANCSWEAVLWTLDLPPELSAKEVNNRFYASNPTSGFQRLAEANTDRNVGTVLAGYQGKCRVEQLFGDAQEFDFASYSPIDLFFVDGCHEYDAARRDTMSAWNSLRAGGILVWHDYTWDSVERAIRDGIPGKQITWVKGTSLAFTEKR